MTSTHHLLCFLLCFGHLFVTPAISTPPQRLYESDSCITGDYRPGTCVQVPECPEALNLVRQHHRHNLTLCGFSGLVEVVCCPKPRPYAQACEKYKKKPEVPKLRPIGLFGIFTIRRTDLGTNSTQLHYDAPYVGALGYYNSEKKEYTIKCVGTIISERYLLTAAHCLDEEVPRTVQVETNFLRTVRRKLGSLQRTIRNCIVHPEYDPDKKSNDVALVELNSKLTLTPAARAACLYDGGDYPKNFTIVGWGATESDESKIKLQTSNVSLVPFESCKQDWDKNGTQLEKSQLCTSTNKSLETVPGGPLLMSNFDFPLLVGVNSFGDSTNQVYTKVSEYLDWIEDNVFRNDSREMVTSGEFPFLVAVNVIWNEMGVFRIKLSCQGTIISENYVLTAGDCFDKTVNYSVRAGHIDFPRMNAVLDPSIDIRVKKSTRHPNYNDKTNSNNIALMELESPLQFGDNVQRIRFATSGSFSQFQKFVVPVWVPSDVDEHSLETIEDLKKFVFVLKKTNVDYEPLDKCQKKYRPKYSLDETQLCAKHNHSDVWDGNFGGPLVMTDSDGLVLVGINSFIQSGCVTGSTHVFTDVSKYTSWINTVMKEKEARDASGDELG